MKKVILIPPSGDDVTEILLQGLIAECGEIIRDQLRPALEAAESPHHKWRYADSAVELVKIAAKVGDAVARLRGGAAGETHHRITVHRLSSKGEGEG